VRSPRSPGVRIQPRRAVRRGTRLRGPARAIQAVRWRSTTASSPSTPPRAPPPPPVAPPRSASRSAPHGDTEALASELARLIARADSLTGIASFAYVALARGFLVDLLIETVRFGPESRSSWGSEPSTLVHARAEPLGHATGRGELAWEERPTNLVPRLGGPAAASRARGAVTPAMRRTAIERA
jgi:hypothetical protein